jgi:cobalt/nickel transport system permease protein
MHLPDGILPVREWLPLSIAAGAVFTAASHRARVSLETRRLPALGFMAAAVLVVQMVNFPIIGGASGHFTGTAFLVFVAGAEPAAIAMASVLAIQALAFQDGGLLALGANYLNLVVAPLLCAMVASRYARRAQDDPRKRSAIIAAGTFVGSVAGALSCSLQLGYAGIAPVRTIAWWLCGCHALIGLVEGVLTAAAVNALARRGLAFGISSESRAPTRWLGSVLALGLAAALLVPAASARPDTLETLLHRAVAARR